MSILFFSCSGENGGSFFKPARIDPPSIEDRVSILNEENLWRHSWQKPALIVQQLGDIQGKTIADIGAGTGYFTFHLAHLNAKVLAIDIDPQMTNHIDIYKRHLPVEIIPNIETRLAEPDDPKIKPEEIDGALIINTISYIDNLDQYLINLLPAFKRNGKLVIVDYKRSNIEIATPPESQLVPTLLLQEYLSLAGFKDIMVDNSSLKYQYIVTAVAP